MPIRLWICIVTSALFVISLSIPLCAQTSPSQFERWPELDAYLGLEPPLRGSSSNTPQELRRRPEWVAFLMSKPLSLFRKKTAGTSRYSSGKSSLTFRVGYAYSHTPAGSSKPSVDHISHHRSQYPYFTSVEHPSYRPKSRRPAHCEWRLHSPVPEPRAAGKKR